MNGKMQILDARGRGVEGRWTYFSGPMNLTLTDQSQQRNAANSQPDLDDLGFLLLHECPTMVSLHF